MILINLLPHREAKRQERKRAFFAATGLSALVGVAMAVGWFGVIQQLTATQRARNAYLEAETRILEEKISEIATLKSEIEALKARQSAVENLQADRNVPVYLLSELVSQTPEGVYLTAVRQTDNVVAILGIAQTNERVSEMLRNTAYKSEWFERPELVEIKSANVAVGREPRRMFEFSMRVYIKRPGTAGGDKAPAPKGGGAKSVRAAAS